MDPGLICLFVITILTFIAFCTKKPSKKAIFSSKRNNDAQIQQLIETLDESIAATENDHLKSNTEPFTAIQLYSKHVNLSEFLGLCQKLCNEKKPEVVTVITVQKLYEKECSSGENEYMTKLVSAIKEYFNHGITNDVCKDPFVVTVHTVKKDVFELYCANTKNTEATRILFAQVNSLIDSYVLETLRSELEKFLMSFVKASMIRTVLAYFLHKSINAKSKLYDTASYYDFYKDLFLEVILCDSFKTYLDSYLKDMHNTKDIYNKLNNCVADMKFKAQISDRINFDKVLPSLLKSKFVFLSAQIAQEMFLTVINILSDQFLRVKIVKAFSEPFKDITKTFEKEFSDYYAKKKLKKSNYLPLKQHYDKYYDEQFFSKLFCSFNFQDFFITKVAQSELVKQTKRNNEEFATNSTKIILNVELTKENFPKIIHTFSNMNVFERTNENQICCVSFGCANVDVIDNITAQLVSEAKLTTWHISADSAHSEDKYDYSITSTHGADSNVIKKRILLDYGTDGNLRQSETTICDIKQVSNKANYRIKKYKTNDYEAFLCQDVREYIDSTIRKRVRNILAVYEITNSGESRDTTRSSIYIIYHDDIGEKNDKQIAIACADDPRITTENGHLQTETLREIRCYKYVSSAVLLELALQIRYLQALPVKFEIPNIITYSVADIYFEENTIRHERINSSTKFRSKVMNLKSGSGNEFRLIAINIDRFLNKESSRPPILDLPIFKQGPTSLESEWFVSVCDKLILSKYAKYFFANNEHIYQDYLLTWIFAFKQMLADNKIIVNVCRRRVKTAINHYFINSSIEVLLALNKDAEIESIIIDVRQDYPSFDLYTITIQSIVDEIFFDKFEISKNRDFDYQEKYSEKLLKILNKQNSENPNPDEKPNESFASKDPIQLVSNCKANQAIKNLITKILQKVDEIEDQNGIVITTILPTMKRESEDNDINDGCIMDSEIFEQLEQQAMFFAEIMESDNKKWNNG